MHPYTGPNPVFIFILVVAIIAAIGMVVYAFKLEKKEKGLAGEEAKKTRSLKYGVFGAFFVLALTATVWGFVMNPISLGQHRDGIVQEIQSTGVVVVEGFEDPSIPLTMDGTAKFVVEAENGLNRCRAVAGGEDVTIQYLCQDEKKEFTVPLAEIAGTD